MTGGVGGATSSPNGSRAARKGTNTGKKGQGKAKRGAEDKWNDFLQIPTPVPQQLTGSSGVAGGGADGGKAGVASATTGSPASPLASSRSSGSDPLGGASSVSDFSGGEEEPKAKGSGGQPKQHGSGGSHADEDGGSSISQTAKAPGSSEQHPPTSKPKPSLTKLPPRPVENPPADSRRSSRIMDIVMNSRRGSRADGGPAPPAQDSRRGATSGAAVMSGVVAASARLSRRMSSAFSGGVAAVPLPLMAEEATILDETLDDPSRAVSPPPPITPLSPSFPRSRVGLPRTLVT